MTDVGASKPTASANASPLSHNYLLRYLWALSLRDFEPLVSSGLKWVLKSSSSGTADHNALSHTYSCTVADTGVFGGSTVPGEG